MVANRRTPTFSFLH